MLNEEYSVLMSVYEKEDPKYLKMSIDSMLNQSLFPNEIVIVKDGRLTYELNEVIEKYQACYPNLFIVVTLAENVGLGLALNEGLKACSNELVARMDTDDISVPERCEIQVSEFIKNRELSILGSNIDEFYDDPKQIVSTRVVPTSHIDIVKFSKRRNPFNHPTVMYKKSEVLKCGGYGNYRRNQDLDLFVRMLNSGCIAANINKPLVLFRANKDNFKRRKSWGKCKSYVGMVYKFWKEGYSSLLDLIIVTVSQLIVFVAPVSFLEWLSNKFLRKTHVK